MERNNTLKIGLAGFTCIALALCASQEANAVDFYLRAATTTLTMPDTNEVITMWGFAKDSALGANDGVVSVPGPLLEIPVSDSTLNIYLTNQLPNLNGQPTPVSIVIPGQIAATTPVRNLDGRVRSFTHETSSGATQVYTWNNMKPGTYIYQSGTHPALQVQMGLYGAVKKDFASGIAYNGKAYDKEVILHYSEIDSFLHAAVANDDFGQGKSVTSTINYKPKYFLVNGKPYSATSSPIAAGNQNEKILLRLLNSGLQTHVPLLQGDHLSIIAEDGRLYPYAREQYSILLPAAKTTDALWTPTAPGTYAVYDRRLHLTNGPSAHGGMLSYLSVAAITKTKKPKLVRSKQ